MRFEPYIIAAAIVLSVGCASGNSACQRDTRAVERPEQVDLEESAQADDVGLGASRPDAFPGGSDDASGGPPSDASSAKPPIGDYVFDSIDRKPDEDCPEVELVEYRGTHVGLNREVELDRRFVPKVRRLEELAVEVAREVYARTPKRLVHRGGYRCRSVKGRKKRWSEHAFGNAIDVIGFDFDGGEDSDGFKVRVGEHWRSKKDADVRHARFLHLLVRRVLDEHVFRIVLGPGDPTHEEILHFDYGTSWHHVVDFPDPPPGSGDE